jgi:hypothetical protein
MASQDQSLQDPYEELPLYPTAAGKSAPIRLLRLLRPKLGDALEAPIQAELLRGDLDHCPKFEALSYTWARLRT